MTTAEKRTYLRHHSPKLLHTLIDKIDDGEFREIDTLAQEITDPILLQYLVTLLSDELVYLTKDEVNK